MFIEIPVLQNVCLIVLYKVTGDEVSAEEVDGDDADNKVPYNNSYFFQNSRTPNKLNIEGFISCSFIIQ